jgi:hypothetical protein
MGKPVSLGRLDDAAIAYDIEIYRHRDTFRAR